MTDYVKKEVIFLKKLKEYVLVELKNFSIVEMRENKEVLEKFDFLFNVKDWLNEKIEKAKYGS